MNIKSRLPQRLLVIATIVILAAILWGVMWALTTPWQQSANAPSTPPASQVNEQASPPRPAITEQQVRIAYIAIGDNGQKGEAIGCEDSVVTVNRVVQATSPIEGALQSLLTDKSERYSTSGLRNALWQSTLTLDAVTLVDQTANIKLSGEFRLAGACDIPRVKAQLEKTVKESADVSVVNITVNGKTLEDALSLK
jgi:spore germination protein GerM